MFEKTDINYIIYLLNRMQQEKTETYQIWNGSANYILNQLLRQIKVPKDNWYISYKADTLWQQLTTDKIEDYHYQRKVTLTRNEKLNVTTYKGNSKYPSIRTLTKGDAFAYREVFHDEHIIPIKIIINQLKALKSPTIETVEPILSKISICRMLKTEDRNIYSSYNRIFDVNEIIETTYIEAGVYVKDYPYTHMDKFTESDLVNSESIILTIPKETIVEFFPHPEPYGYKMAQFPNGMYTDVYENGTRDYYSKTNDVALINYIKMLQKVFGKSV